MARRAIAFRGVQPAQRVVAEHVRELIRAEGLRPGDLLPTYQKLAKSIGVSYVTVKRGLDILAAEGLVCRIASKGTFVTTELALLPRPLQNLGVICASSRTSLFAHSYLTEIMHGAMHGAAPQPRLHIFSLHEDGLVGAAQLAEAHVDGVLLLGVENDDYLRMFARWGIPGVVVDYCPQSDVPLEHVACDNRAAAEHVVAHLAALGHRRVAFAAVPASNPVLARATNARLLVRESSDVRERQAESLRALREQGLQATVLAPSSAFADALAATIVDQLLALPDRPTALMTGAAMTAVHLVAALERRGLRIPEDISVCAVAGDRDAVYHRPLVTHGCFDFFRMGNMAVKRLVARCLGPGAAIAHGPRIGYKFGEGETTSAVHARRLAAGAAP